MRSFIYLCVTAASIAGCATQEEISQMLANKTDAGLCVDWMTSPSINMYQPHREAEIKRRGLDCSKYGDVAASRIQSNQATSAELERIRQSTQRAPEINCTSVRNGNAISTKCR